MTSNYQTGAGFTDAGYHEDVRIAIFRLRQAIANAARLGLPSEVIINLGLALKEIERASQIVDNKEISDE